MDGLVLLLFDVIPERVVRHIPSADRQASPNSLLRCIGSRSRVRELPFLATVQFFLRPRVLCTRPTRERGRWPPSQTQELVRAPSRTAESGCECEASLPPRGTSSDAWRFRTCKPWCTVSRGHRVRHYLRLQSEGFPLPTR